MVADYINYFRQLAVSHKDLQHNPESETGDGPAGSMHFTSVTEDQTLMALHSAVGWPLLAVQLYHTETDSEIVSDVKLLPKGSFHVLDNPADKSFLGMQACFIKCEKITRDILKKIWQDHFGPEAEECETPFEFFEYDKMSIDPVGPVFSGQFGYSVVFAFREKDFDITQAPEEGTFI